MSAEAIRLRDRYEIRFDQPLPAIAFAGTTAYAARDIRSPGPPLAAIIPDIQFPPRIAVATAIRAMRQPPLWTPTEWGVVDCPPIGRRSWVVVGDFPDGGRLATEISGKFSAWSELDINQKLLLPLLPALKALAVDDIAHRGIRLDNIWYRDQQRRIVMLGDAVCTPPALHQPFVYDTIESSLADPAGRGPGRVSDDYYSLGVLVVHLLSGQIPCEGLSDDEILERKVTKGSLNSLTANLRLSPPLMDLCRGLLADNPIDRWSVNEVANWVEGRRIPFKPPTQEATASRPYVLDDVAYLTTRALARALVQKGGEAVEAASDKALLVWLQRALPATSKCKDMLPRALDDGDERDANIHGQRLVTRVAMALDPAAPIRYRGISTHPDALGTMLAAANLGDEAVTTIKAVAEIVKARLVQFWTECQTNTQVDYDIWCRDQDRLRQFLSDHRPGYGIERVSYELNRYLHCLSPAIEPAQVASIEELLPALEQAAEFGSLTAQGVDRHIVAFIASRTKLYNDPLATMLSHADPGERFLGSLSLLSRIQSDYGPAKLRALAALFRPQAIPLINRFHSRGTRRRLQSMTEEAIASGRLSLLLEALNNNEERLRDQQQFNRAVVRCAEAQRNIRSCAHDLDLAPLHGEETAHTISELLAALIGAAVAGFAIFSAWTI